MRREQSAGTDESEQATSGQADLEQYEYKHSSKTLRVGLFNWNDLASRRGLTRMEALFDSFAAMVQEDVDVLLPCELSTATSTPPLDSDFCKSDWTIGKPGNRGHSVGVFFNRRLHGKWDVAVFGLPPFYCRLDLVTSSPSVSSVHLLRPTRWS